MSAPISQTGGQSSPVANLGTLAGVYRTPAIHVDVTAVFTNTHPMRPYRGNGRPEAAYIIERMIDLAAAETGLDPVEIRRRNIIPPEAMPFKTGLTFTYDCGEFEKNMDLALAMADHAGFAARREEARRRGKLRGIGLSNSIERAAAGMEGAEIRFDRAGTLTVFSGAVTHGQGHETIFKQLVCERLGVAPDDISYVQGDTDRVFFGEGTGGSRTATLGGSSLKLAADRIVEKGTRVAAHLLGVEPDSVTFARRPVRDAGEQPHPDDEGGRQGGRRSGRVARRHGARPRRDGGVSLARREFPERLPRLRARDRRGDRRGRDRALQRRRRCRHGHEPASPQGPDPAAASRKGSDRC